MTNKNYMVTYTKEGNENFSCVLVEAINEELAKKTSRCLSLIVNLSASEKKVILKHTSKEVCQF